MIRTTRTCATIIAEAKQLKQAEQLELERFVQALIDVVDEYGRDKTIDGYHEDGISPADINDGNCADFAHEIHARFPEAEIVADSDFYYEYNHTFLRFRGRYYDSEAVNGVDDWKKLPIYINHPTILERQDRKKRQNPETD